MSVSKPTVLLEHYLKQLKLPTMLREYAKLASLCQSERADYQTFLLRLCEREVHDRELRAAERRVKDAKSPMVKTLDTSQPYRSLRFTQSIRCSRCRFAWYNLYQRFG